MTHYPLATPKPEQDPVSERYLPWVEYCYLWVADCPGGHFVKVGRTNDPNRRFCEFKTSSPFKWAGAFICQVPTKEAGYALEQRILHTFRALSTRGEWLALEKKKLNAFVAACTRIAREMVCDEVRFRPHVPRRQKNAWKARTKFKD